MSETLSFLGDIHADFSRVYSWQSIAEDSHLFQVGDFGMGYRGTYNTLVKLNKLLKDRNNNLYAIRGNHDNPEWFDGRRNLELSNIHLIPDNSILTICGKKILCIGGAVSIDRLHPTRGNISWPGEEFKYVDGMDDILASNPDIDIIATHIQDTTLNGVGKDDLVMNYAENDNELLRDLDLEQKELEKLVSGIRKSNWPDKNRYWINGHYHRSLSLKDNKWTYIGLAIGEIYEIREYQQ